MELGTLGEQVLTQNPVRGIPEPALQFIAVLDDAARLNRGEGKCPRLNSETTRPEYGLVERLAVELHHRAVRLDGASSNVFHVVETFGERNFDISPFATFLGENFDAVVRVLTGRAEIAVVAVDFAIKDDRGRSWSLRLAGHLELVGRDRRKALGDAA